MGEHPTLAGKSALVTGASRGLGRAIARALLDAGARVYVTARHAEACRELADELAVNGSCVAAPADLSRESECARLGAELRATGAPLHILVNNAGTAWGAPLAEFPAARWNTVMDLNLRAPFLLTQSLLELLTGAAGPDDPARVINIGSIEGLRVPDQPAYSYAASKAGLHHLTRVLARELGACGITVNAIAPGVVPTTMTAAVLDDREEAIRARTPLGRLGTAADVAAGVLYLAGPDATFVTGAVLPIDGGLSMTF